MRVQKRGLSSLYIQVSLFTGSPRPTGERDVVLAATQVVLGVARVVAEVIVRHPADIHDGKPTRLDRLVARARRHRQTVALPAHLADEIGIRALLALHARATGLVEISNAGYE